MGTDENKALARRFFEGMNQQSLDVIDELLVTDYVHHDPSLPPDMQRGRENYRQGILMFYTAFPDLSCTVEDQIAEEDRVVTRLDWHGTNTGPFMGMPATGRQARFSMIAIGRIEDGKIAEAWVNFDAMGMMQQLGAIPQPATP